MPESAIKLVLLPGMDGTGDLFREFIEFLPETVEPVILRYPTGTFLSYSELMVLLQEAVPSLTPYVILAESYSTPLAIQFASTKPPNLKGLILCAGFAFAPVEGWKGTFYSIIAPLLFRLKLSDFASRRFLVGSNAPSSLLAEVREAVESVHPKVLIERLRTILSCDVSEELSRIAIPILYVRATQDRLVSLRCLDEIRRIRPHAATAGIDGPHLILQREPKQVADAAIVFLQQL